MGKAAPYEEVEERIRLVIMRVGLDATLDWARKALANLEKHPEMTEEPAVRAVREFVHRHKAMSVDNH